MKKTAVCLMMFLFCFNSICYANYDGYKFYIKGLLALKSGDINVAIAEYEKVLSYDSEAVSVYKDLASIYWQQGNTQKALEIAKKLQEIDGESVKTNAFLGTFYLSINEMILAKQSWEKVLELDPKNEMATVYLAAYYYSDNKLKESVDYWNKFLQQQPESSEGYFQLGLVQEKLGMLDEALESYKKVNELKPEAREAYLARARIYENKKEFNLAVKEYEEYVKVFPDNISILLYLGKCYFEEKRYAEAEEIVLRAKKISPNNITLNYLLGMIYEKQVKIDKAIDTFNFIVKNEPTASGFTRLGYYYALKHDYKNAGKNFNKALELEPLNAEIYYLAGLNYIDYKKYDNAKNALERALYLKPNFTEAKFYLATVYDELGDFEKAETVLKEIIELDADNPNARVLNYLGYSYAEKNIKLDEAEKLLTKAVEADPNNPAFLDSIAWMYYRTSRYKDAEKYSFMAINTQPQFFDKELYEHLGDISIELNKLPQAWLAYAVACDIGSSVAKKKMKLIEKKISQNDINKVSAERAVLNFKRISALKAGYKLKIVMSHIKTNSFLSVLYGSHVGIKVDVAPKLSFQGFSVFLQNGGGNAEFNPQGVKSSLSNEVISMFEFANVILSKDFIKILFSAQITNKGKIITYTNGDYVIKIDQNTGLFKEFSKKDLLNLKITSYKQFNNLSKIPSAMIFSAEKTKFKCGITLDKAVFPMPNDFQSFIGTHNNDNKSSGKN